MTDRIDTALIIHPDTDEWEYIIDTTTFADEIVEENALYDKNGFWTETNRFRNFNTVYTEQT